MQGGVVALAHAGVGEQRVDRGRRQEEPRHPIALDRVQHHRRLDPVVDDDRAAFGQGREAEGARGVGHRRRHQVGRAAVLLHMGVEAEAHRAELAVVDDDSLRRPGRAAAAEEHQRPRRVVGEGRCPGAGGSQPGFEIGAELIVAEAHRAADPRRGGEQRLGPLAISGRVNEEVAVEQGQQLGQLVVLGFRVQRDPAGAGPQDADNRRVAERPVGGEDGDLGARAQIPLLQRRGDAVGKAGEFPVGEAEAAVGADHAERLGVEAETAVQVVDEHRLPIVCRALPPGPTNPHWTCNSDQMIEPRPTHA